MITGHVSMLCRLVDVSETLVKQYGDDLNLNLIVYSQLVIVNILGVLDWETIWYVILNWEILGFCCFNDFNCLSKVALVLKHQTVTPRVAIPEFVGIYSLPRVFWKLQVQMLKVTRVGSYPPVIPNVRHEWKEPNKNAHSLHEKWIVRGPFTPSDLHVWYDSLQTSVEHL